MKKIQLFVYLMSLLFVMAQAQTAKENNFLTSSATSNSLRVSSNRMKAVTSVNKVQISKTINVVTAGTLKNLLTTPEKKTLTNFTVTGNLDARDFKLMRDSLPLLEVLDVSAVNIKAYSGTAGPYTNQSYSYPANEIPAYAFCKMDVANPNTTLKSFVFPVTATSIGEATFGLCTGFTSINLPATINTIKDMAFVGFYGSFTVDSNNPNYAGLDGILMNKAQQSIIQCPVLKSGSYVIPSSIKVICNYAFYGCSLISSVTIPVSVTSIGSYAFFNCTGLTSMTVNTRPDKITLGSSCFYYANTSSCALNVPFGTKTLFQYASQWSDFVNVVENEHGFMLNMSSMMLSSKISTAKLAIITNDAWTVTADQTWITLNKTSGAGTDTIQITSSENPTTENRTATLTFSVNGFDSQIVTITQAGLPKIVNTSAGGLSASMTSSDLSSVINLKITGTIDARDFKTMRDNMPKLAFLDLSEAIIAAYSGLLGTSNATTTYPANRIPDYAFNLGASSQQFTLAAVSLPASINAIGEYAFYSCEALTDIVIPNSVTYIGNGAFGSCNSLVNITLPNQLTSIGNSTFMGSAILNIIIPNTVKTIDTYAFAFCRNLKSIIIPNSVTTIANTAFQYCSGLTDITFGNSLASIGNGAFSNCSSLTSATIPNSVTLLDGNAFGYCTKLKTVTLSNSLTTIGYGCFQNCTSLTNVSIPNSVTKIDYSAFSYCNSLSSITIPNSVTTLGYSAFSYCSALTTLSIPNSVTSIGSNAFDGCTGLTSINVNRDVPLNLSASTSVFNNVNKISCILNVPFGTRNRYAAANQWQDFSNITENIHGISLGTDSVKLLSTEGSKGSVSIKSNDSWTTLSNQTWLRVTPDTGTGNDTLKLTADANVSSLKRTATVTVTSGDVSKTITVIQTASPKIVNITAGTLASALTPAELSTITNLTISGTINARDFKIMRDSMPTLETVDLSTAAIVAYTGSLGTAGNYTYAYPVNEIPQNAFFNSGTYTGKVILNTISLPASATSIGASAFQYCTGLITISIPDSVTLIGGSAFQRCTGISSVHLSNSLTTIGDHAFDYCSGLLSLVIPNSVITMDNMYVFSNCTKLKNVTLGSSLQTIGYAAFQNCTSLTNLGMNTSLKTIGDHTFEYTALTGLILPESVTSIGYATFGNCKSLLEVVLPNSLTTVGNQAFSSCSGLKKITLGNALTTIKSEAFYNCTSLTSIVIPESVIAIEGSVFYNCSGLLSITTNSLIPVDLSSSQTVFKGVDKTLCTLNIPYQTKPLYSTTDQWKDFVNIIENPYGLKLDLTAARLSSKAGSNVSVNVTSNTNWSALSNQSWLAVSSTSGSGNKLITFTAEENSSTVPRTAIVTVSAAGLPDKTITITQAAIAKTLQVIAGGLSTSLSATELSTVSNLILTGTIDARDFKTMRDNMPLLTDLDLSGTTILAYTGSEGTVGSYSYTYPAATIPIYCFWSVITNKPTSKIISVVLPASTVSIGQRAFQSCSNLFSIKLPATLTSISDYAFQSCTGLGEISLPNSLLTLGSYSFSSCTGLKTLKFGSSLTTINNCAFEYCSALRSVALPNSITTFGDAVFQYCTALTDVSFGNLMTTTGNSAFRFCSSLKNITLPNSMTTVGISAFQSCINLLNVKFGSSLTTISNTSFSSCSKLDNVLIPNTVTTLDFRAFLSCSALKNITLSNSLTTIGSEAFSGCYGLTDIVIPNSVTTINDAAFSGCSALNNIKFSSKLTTIGRNAFSSCLGLGDVILPNSVTTIGDYAFSTYTGMKSFTIPAGISSLGSSSISSSGLTAIYSLASNPITPGYSGVFSSVNKSTCVLYVPKGSKAIYQSTSQWKDFANISEDFWFLLENQVIHIKSGGGYTIDMPTDKTFTVESNQTWLKATVVSDNGSYKIVLASDTNPDVSLRTAFITISFPNGPTRTFTVIQSGSSKTVTVSSGNLRTSLTSSELNTVSNLILTGTIDARDFRVMRDSMPQLTDIDLKNITITAYSGSEGTNPSISSYPANETPINAFYKTYSGIGKETLASVILPANITSIGQSSFAYANGLTSIVIPDQVTVIGMTAFARCEGLKGVTIGNSVTTIGVEAFYICTKLSEVSIPNSVTTLSNEAFSNCVALKSIIFSNNLRTIGADAFVFCRSLTNVEIPNSVTTIETGAFRYCYKLARVVLPTTLTELKYDVFYYCPLLTEIKLPETLKIIGPEAFAYCTGLSTISIPASVNNIGYNAFSNCSSLSSIYAYPVSPVDLSSTSLSSNVFNNVNTSTCTLYVPTNSKTLYQSAIQWKNFVNIIEMTTALPTLTDANIRIYPNPVKESFRISGLNEKAVLSIMDLSGKVVLNKQIDGSEAVSVSELPQGGYIARIGTSVGVLDRKLLKK